MTATKMERLKKADMKITKKHVNVACETLDLNSYHVEIDRRMNRTQETVA